MTITERENSEHINCIKFAMDFSELFGVQINDDFLAEHGSIIRKQLCKIEGVDEATMKLNDKDLA